MIILLFIPQSILLVVIGCSGPISILRCVVAIFWINIWHALQKQKNCAIKYFTNEQTEIQSKGRGKGSKQKRIWTNKIKKNVMRATWFEHATIGPGIRRSAVGATPPQLVLPIFLFWITSPVMVPFERVIFLFRFAILIFPLFRASILQCRKRNRRIIRSPTGIMVISTKKLRDRAKLIVYY